jgi:hypothetical protein
VAFLVAEETLLMKSILSWTAALVLIPAAGMLGHAAAPPVVSAARIAPLIEKLDHDRFNVRERADRDLRKFGSRVVGLLRTEMARSSSVEVRRRLRRMIQHLTIGARVPALVKELGHSESHIQALAAWELRRGGKTVVPLLKKELKGSLSKEHRQRVEAIIAELSAPETR